MKIKITADSTCDLSPALIQQYDIGIVPLYVSKQGEFFRDGVDITTEDIFRHVSAGGDMCTTAAVNVAEYCRIFSELKKENDAIIHFTISASMSSCYQNAAIAAAELSDVYVIDAQNLSTGIGQLAIEAALLARQGVAPKEIVASVEQLRPNLDVSFILDTLEYLRKGGRCSAVAALGANLLSLKPCIEVHGGAMRVGKKYRGSLDKCIERYIQERLADADSLDLRRIFITYAGKMDQRLLDIAESTVKKCAPFREVYQTNAGCTVSSHCGPNCLGVLFFRKKPLD